MLEEWHSYETGVRRHHVLFQVDTPHFLLQEHRSIVCIEMFDALRGHIRLRIQRPRSFFAKILPDARFMFISGRKLPPRAAPAAWCSTLPRRLLDKY